MSCCGVQAMFAGFLEADATCKARFKTSGTTATLAVVVGWEVFVANVGDSAAYLDTGKQVRSQPPGACCSKQCAQHRVFNTKSFCAVVSIFVALLRV